MLKIYGSDLCPDCREAKMNFDHYGIAYEYHDVTKSLRDLSIFLKMRDTLPVFDYYKEIGDIAFPACVKEDGTVFVSWETFLKEQGLEVLHGETQGAACAIR